MNTTYSLLLVAAVIIILALAGYAWYLLRKVRKVEAQQKAEQAQAEMNLRKRQQNLLQDIRLIAKAVTEDQCEITEGVMRLQYLITALDPEVWEAGELTLVREHHAATSDMPILEQYKALTPKQQFSIDSRRYALEEKNNAGVKRELKWLIKHQFGNVTLIQ